MDKVASQVQSFESLRIVRLPILTSVSDFKSHQWTAQDLRAYLSANRSNPNSLPLYNGVLFDADLTNQGAMISPWSMGFGHLAKIDDWLAVAKELFQPKINVTALRECSQWYGAKPVDVWIGLPYPFEQKSVFGIVGAQELRFLNNADARADALLWWIDRVLTTMLTDHRDVNDKVFETTVRMRGFVWTRGTFWGTDQETFRKVAQGLHRRKLALVRIQNENADDTDTHEPGGASPDITVIRPSYRQHRTSGLYAFFSPDNKVALVESVAPKRGAGEP
ncbi:DUF4855 domain-containing protein [Alicyclobacillus sp. SO9]|uniref:DUF4855 domain-containing protein n=1 Tax=Alicyclobacillus sp. SO9 TaxID=2665646 RepID=UPI0018E81796|nr:DUF4855 domain-containing protein [Alicyclobacillus sp. SO9]QQE80317.1 DUF4855 domain-containing protein [Alicyclobacillus sp. SO9]